MKPTWWTPEELAGHIESRTVIDAPRQGKPLSAARRGRPTLDCVREAAILGGWRRERGQKVNGAGTSVPRTLDRLLKERAELAGRVDALDAEIRNATAQRRHELLGQLAMAVRSVRDVRRWSRRGEWLGAPGT